MAENITLDDQEINKILNDLSILSAGEKLKRLGKKVLEKLKPRLYQYGVILKVLMREKDIAKTIIYLAYFESNINYCSVADVLKTALAIKDESITRDEQKRIHVLLLLTGFIISKALCKKKSKLRKLDFYAKSFEIMNVVGVDIQDALKEGLKYLPSDFKNIETVQELEELLNKYRDTFKLQRLTNILGIINTQLAIFSFGLFIVLAVLGLKARVKFVTLLLFLLFTARHKEFELKLIRKFPEKAKLIKGLVKAYVYIFRTRFLLSIVLLIIGVVLLDKLRHLNLDLYSTFYLPLLDIT